MKRWKCRSLVTYVSSAAESDDHQQQWPQATHQSRGGEALSPAATASGSPHARPCRSRRGDRTNLQKARRRRRRRRRSVRASSLLLLPLLPHSSLLPLHLGCAGALKHSCSAEWRAEVAGSQRLEGKESTSQSDDTFTFSRYKIRAPRDSTYALSATGLLGSTRSCDEHAQSHLPLTLSSSTSTDVSSTPPPSLSPPSPPCPLNKSIQNQPNPAAGGKPAPRERASAHARTHTHTPTHRKRDRENNEEASDKSYKTMITGH